MKYITQLILSLLRKVKTSQFNLRTNSLDLRAFPMEMHYNTWNSFDSFRNHPMNYKLGTHSHMQGISKINGINIPSIQPIIDVIVTGKERISSVITSEKDEAIKQIGKYADFHAKNIVNGIIPGVTQINNSMVTKFEDILQKLIENANNTLEKISNVEVEDSHNNIHKNMTNVKETLKIIEDLKKKLRIIFENYKETEETELGKYIIQKNREMYEQINNLISKEFMNKSFIDLEVGGSFSNLYSENPNYTECLIPEKPEFKTALKAKLSEAKEQITPLIESTNEKVHESEEYLMSEGTNKLVKELNESLDSVLEEIKNVITLSIDDETKLFSEVLIKENISLRSNIFMILEVMSNRIEYEIKEASLEEVEQLTKEISRFNKEISSQILPQILTNH